MANLFHDRGASLKIPAVRARRAELGYAALGGTPEDYGRIIGAEVEKWEKIVREAGIKVQ
ncbi:MAG: hypothetical protein A3G24_13790 [Betaproteobacteria bacterium RIFCSPLOWO2_12_FULL_62_13]|nr:MAG: hypothetical protein A3G24_13790 [Betaproteobacteria bacterium RIFCSPLOWO2_12_FULL_62_13]